MWIRTNGTTGIDVDGLPVCNASNVETDGVDADKYVELIDWTKVEVK